MGRKKGKRKGKKSLSRRARQELRQEQDQRQAWNAGSKKWAKKCHDRSVQVGEKALRQSARLDLKDLGIRGGFVGSQQTVQWQRLRQLAPVVWEKRPGLLEEPYLTGVLDLCHVPFARTISQWQVEGKGLSMAFRSLAQFVLGPYRVDPRLLDSLLMGDSDGVVVLARTVACGSKVRNLVGGETLPAPLTKKMCHLLVNPTRPLALPGLVRRAQVLAYGGSEALVSALAQSTLGAHGSRGSEIFWDRFIHWLCRQPDVELAQVGPVSDFIANRYQEEGQFNLKGRIWNSVTREMEKWHKELNDLNRFKNMSDFTKSGFAPSTWKKTKRFNGEETLLETWGLKEIRNPKELVSEGMKMGHCVAGYHSAIASGKSSIWSLTMNDVRRLTIEVHNRSHKVVQVRGKYNRFPDAQEGNFVRKWASKNGLKIVAYELDI